MGDYCEIFLSNTCYTAGETITGRVHCHFIQENDVRNIYLRFKGKAKVYWKEGKVAHSSEELYFEMESPLLRDRTVFPPGDYDYPFSFNLRSDIPSTVIGKYGEIKYTVVAKVDKPFALDYKSEKEFRVEYKLTSPYISQNSEYEQPLQLTEEHIPFMALFSTNPIRLTVNMPKRKYIVSEMVSFTAKLENFSKTTVKQVQFHLRQGFLYFDNDYKKQCTEWEGQEYAIIDSVVESNSHKSWELEIRVPQNIFAGNLLPSKIMKSFWELCGEVVLPFPNTNFKIKIPLQIEVS